ncbi:hypothetical protein L2E82_33066 [Cichorium intybus]|uniref:Uncharacterized protein n=1 Tax=Cichorium intybus TaxID=13427 RepID=A0ACB9BJ65_CICIN|nr:hypothetical protein L2E82_33066 [Cichorium intybus]
MDYLVTRMAVVAERFPVMVAVERFPTVVMTGKFLVVVEMVSSEGFDFAVFPQPPGAEIVKTWLSSLVRVETDTNSTQFKTVVLSMHLHNVSQNSEYLEFLELLLKPVENLPSAEIQLERKEAEQAEGGQRGSLPNGKLRRRANGASSSSSSNPAPIKRGCERRRTSTTMVFEYVLRDNTGKGRNGKEKSTYVQVHKHDDQPSVSSDIGKKKILLLKGKEKEIPNVSF